MKRLYTAILSIVLIGSLNSCRVEQVQPTDISAALTTMVVSQQQKTSESTATPTPMVVSQHQETLEPTATSSCSVCRQLESGAQGDHTFDHSSIKHWLYILDIDYSPELVEIISDSIYDLVVVDYVPSQKGSEGESMAPMLERWHTSQHPKLVLAYINIGEAEDYRTYWQPGWRIGNPDWIIDDNEEGWQGNYPVAYWQSEWKQIWLGEGGILEQILEEGFDGIYMDNLEVFSDDRVIDRAVQNGINTRFEMISLAYSISNEVHTRKPGFLVIGQNALELLQYEKYAGSFDGVAQEHVWFDGGVGDDLQGDCPLPATSEDMNSTDYFESLSDDCKDYYEEYPEGTLHTSSEAYLSYLQLAQANGLMVLTVDYALDEENIQQVISTSRTMGFIPFVGRRALDQYVEPVP